MKYIDERNEPKGDCKYRQSQNRHMFLLIDEDGKCLAWQEVPNHLPEEERERIALNMIYNVAEYHNLYPNDKKMLLKECACTANFDYFVDNFKMRKNTIELNDDTRAMFFDENIIADIRKEINPSNSKVFTRKQVLDQNSASRLLELGGTPIEEINLIQSVFNNYRGNMLSDPKQERDRIKQERVDRMLRDISAF